jgi:hypothetical protein
VFICYILFSETLETKANRQSDYLFSIPHGCSFVLFTRSKASLRQVIILLKCNVPMVYTVKTAGPKYGHVAGWDCI